MGSWYFAEIGITATENDVELKKQFLDCIGFGEIGGHRSKDPYYDRTYDLLYKKDDMIFGENGDYDLYAHGYERIPFEQYFEILNILFSTTYLHVQYFDGTSVTVYWNVHQYLFDPVKNSVKEYLAGEDNEDYVIDIPDWCDGEIEAYIDDDESDDGEDVYYSYKEFKDLDEEQKQKIEESHPCCGWSGQRTIKYKSEKINKELVREILDESVKKGYVELSALIMDKCKDYLKNK